jgi:hypothetical protein
MTIEDGWDILNGEENEATMYLKENTSSELYDKFKPEIKKSLEAVGVTKYYSDIISTYNKIPFIQKVNPDLDDYATKEAINGLFFLIAQEEKKIRDNPLERTSDLLQKVFGYGGN